MMTLLATLTLMMVSPLSLAGEDIADDAIIINRLYESIPLSSLPSSEAQNSPVGNLLTLYNQGYRPTRKDLEGIHEMGQYYSVGTPNEGEPQTLACGKSDVDGYEFECTRRSQLDDSTNQTIGLFSSLLGASNALCYLDEFTHPFGTHIIAECYRRVGQVEEGTIVYVRGIVMEREILPIGRVSVRPMVIGPRPQRYQGGHNHGHHHGPKRTLIHTLKPESVGIFFRN